MSGNHTAEGARFRLGQEVRWTQPEWSEAVKYLKAKQRDRRALHLILMDEFRHSSVMLSSHDWHLLASWELRVLDIDLSTPSQLTDGVTDKGLVALLKQEGIAVIRISTDEELQRELAGDAKRFEQEKLLFELFRKLRASKRKISETEKTIQETKLTQKPALEALVQCHIQEEANSKENCWSKLFGWLTAILFGWFRAKFCQQTLTKNQIKKLKRKAKRAETDRLRSNCPQ